MREHRDGAERQIAVARRDVARARDFGDVELAAAQKRQCRGKAAMSVSTVSSMPSGCTMPSFSARMIA